MREEVRNCIYLILMVLGLIFLINLAVYLSER